MDPLKPDTSLLCALGSAIVHADEAMSEHGAAEDEAAFRAVLSDPRVVDWLNAMERDALVPVKRA